MHRGWYVRVGGLAAAGALMVLLSAATSAQGQTAVPLAPAEAVQAAPADTQVPAYTPVPVAGLSTGITAISTGDSHSCALTTTGAVKCWGLNLDGELGNNSAVDSAIPVDVAGLASGVKAIAAGDRHTCAITSTDGVKCWGDNSFGQLGNGVTGGISMVPVDVTGLTGVTAITLGDSHTCAITGGTVQCWGKNDVGQLGNSSNTDSNVPVAVTGLTGIASVSAGDEHTCSLSSTGVAQCWGSNGSGRLGNDPNTLISSNVPVAVAALIVGPPKSITAGGSHTCAVDAQDGLECWGDNTLGQLGDGTNTLSSTPLVVSPPLDTGVALGAAGESHTCAVTSTGGAMCWGSNAAGELGNGVNTPSNVPVDVTGMTTGVASISSGANLTCSLSTLGAVSCWGNIFVFTGTPTFTVYLPFATAP